VLRVEASLDNLCLLKPLEPRRQGVRADPGQAALEILKLARSEADQLAQDEDCPTLAELTTELRR
jgi:hypothetical protein